jgi:hypothetical protein
MAPCLVVDIGAVRVEGAVVAGDVTAGAAAVGVR